MHKNVSLRKKIHKKFTLIWAWSSLAYVITRLWAKKFHINQEKSKKIWKCLRKTLGHNHVNKTAILGIVAHHLWEENLGNVTEVFVNDSFQIVARFCCPNSLGRISPGKMDQGNPYQRVRGNKTEEFGQQSQRNH